MDMSKLHFYSFGKVAEDKIMSSDMVEIIPLEQMPFVDGEVKSNPTTTETKGVDGAGNAYTTSTVSDNTLNAKWLPMGSNRVSSPDVRRGERVLVWQYADEPNFYWTDLGWDQHLRRCETAQYVWSATQDESTTKLDATNSYSMEVSTHNKTWTLKTSKANGEAFAYTVQINAADGAVVITDDADNYFEVDSPAKRITLHNGDESEIILDAENIIGNCNDSMTFTATNNVAFNCTDFSVVAKDSATIKASNSVTLDTPQTTTTGSLGVQGGGGGGASCSVQGDMNVTGGMSSDTLTVAKTIHCKQLISEMPIIAPNVN